MEKEVNPHFEDFLFDWDQKFQFLVGGYGSSKSYHIALKLILKLLDQKRTALVIREVYDTHRDSTFSLFEEIVNDLGLDHVIQCRTSPLMLKFHNGSRIIFKGLDEPAKLKSINNISIIWIEECSEVKYEGFKELLGRLRHPTLDLHMILSTNPVGQDNWTYRHFFKDDQNNRFILDDEKLYKERTIVINDTYYHHSTAEDNLFLPKSYVKQLDELKEYDPDLYRIARKGHFGINGIRVLPQFEVQPHDDVMLAISNINRPLLRAGMDFGFVDSYNAVVRLAVDHEKKYLYIYWEYYDRGKTDDVTVEDLKEFVETKELIKADNEQKTIAYFRKMGYNMVAAHKFQGSRLQYTKKIKRFKKIICSDSCKNTIYELQPLTYKTDKRGNIIEDEFQIDPHTFSAIWYALDDYEVTDLKEKPKERTRPNRERRSR
ncbi:PBSX family phage terminase large subunit [Bacillus altitudinis]|uniref:PBSX family phage terminase large subunit n=1 Tax=Bacillus altitudinis TaxID=293387 RepID=UPI00227FA319|nr:PBSX family phage terminase large subunit [Bacillus altitudinis]MCY7498231.1 PBSX family phage terminase large subunit [Bacillus altitudinis]MCY7535448.1 PBSX family phage terminase large subunit [Bacillus altitudinis]MCY7545465.1 PBSX family phage terminase large subunit [Bacillus altitudinis]MCY7553565.1 PBSX family phage terminase large subunit [Bacillus altitudinis]MCY7592199.1 PBSX family phage terminase large subunit [Bacillus altitudinis]